MQIAEMLQQLNNIKSWDISEEVEALRKKLMLIDASARAITIPELIPGLTTFDFDVKTGLTDLYDMVNDVAAIQTAALEVKQNAFNAPIVESVEVYEARQAVWSNKEYMAKIRELDLFTTDDETEKFNNIIRKHSSWQYPSVYIRPNSLKFFDALKASDVLYVMDQCPLADYLYRNLSLAEFNLVHFKVIDEFADTFITHLLPPQQAGLIVMDNFMNFKPLHIMKQYLKESLAVLRPGGHLIFTYNDCDHASGAINFDNGHGMFTPGVLVRELCELMGFEITQQNTADRVSWLCMVKPGKLTSLKGGKTLGVIHKDNTNT